MALDEMSFSILLDTVRRFTRERLIPNERKTSNADCIPEELVREMKELGLFGLTIPEEYGGTGISAVQEMQVIFELGEASPAYRGLLCTNLGACSQALIKNGTEEQKKRYLPRLASGEINSSFAVTEPNSGSAKAMLQTRARRVAGGYLLSGTKRHITNAPVAGLFMVMARTGESVEPGGISCFLIEAGTKGLSLGKPDRKMGHSGAMTCDVILDDCWVPESALLGAEGGAFERADAAIWRNRIHIAALCVGAAERLIRDAVRFALNRRVAGTPISEFQLIQAMIADSKVDTVVARAFVLEAARRLDIGDPVALEASSAKLFASEMVGRVADRALQIHGGAGYMEEYDVERFYRDVRLFRLFDGTSQIHQLIVAQETLKSQMI